jgi:hypothetical protein
MGEDAPAAVIRTIAIELPGLPLSSELLHHLIAREAGRLAVDRRCDSVTLFVVEARRFNAERRQRDPRAAASSALLFCHREYPAADPCTAPILGQKEPGDTDEPEFGSPVEPADDLAGLRIADEQGERAKIVVSGLVQIVGAETTGDDRYVGGIKHLGHRDFWSDSASSFGKFASHRTGPVAGLQPAA